MNLRLILDRRRAMQTFRLDFPDNDVDVFDPCFCWCLLGTRVPYVDPALKTYDIGGAGGCVRLADDVGRAGDLDLRCGLLLDRSAESRLRLLSATRAECRRLYRCRSDRGLLLRAFADNGDRDSWLPLPMPESVSHAGCSVVEPVAADRQESVDALRDTGSPGCPFSGRRLLARFSPAGRMDRDGPLCAVAALHLADVNRPL